MPIEFRCPNCDQQLRVPDTAGGKNAKCPKCATVLAVPASSSAASPPAPLGPPPQQAFNFGTAPAPPRPAPPAPPTPAAPKGAFGPPPLPTQPSFPTASGGGSFGAPPPSNPFGGPPASPFGDAQSGPNPFAMKPAETATVNPYASPTGGFHVQQYAVGGGLGHQIVEVGPVLNYSLKVWQNNLGILIAITLLPAVVMLPLVFLMWGGMMAAAAAELPELIPLVVLIFIPLSMVANVYLSVGQTQMILKICRGQPTAISELFAGGEKFLVTLGWAFLSGFALFLGFLMLGVPGIIMLFLFWPSHFLVVDGKCGVMESYNKAYTITQGNHLTTFLVYLCGVGFSTLGAMACYIGLIFAVPLISVMWATAYLMMSGQIAVPPRAVYGPPQGQPMYR